MLLYHFDKRSVSILVFIVFVVASLAANKAQANSLIRIYRTIAHEDKCVDINNRLDSLILFDCNGEESQLWAYCPISGKIFSKTMKNKCINFDGLNSSVYLGLCNKKASWQVSEREARIRLASRPDICLSDSTQLANHNNGKTKQQLNYLKIITTECSSDKKEKSQQWLFVLPEHEKPDAYDADGQKITE